MKAEKVAVLISGGVDSAVSAFLLKQKGFEVLGVFMELMHLDQPEQLSQRLQQAEKVCTSLNIPFHHLSFSARFKEKVFDPFMEAYAKGYTPNPCVKCNQSIKFGEAMDYVLNSLDVSRMASGHYVRLIQDERGYYLKKGLDPIKDQSYVLYTLKQTQLAKLAFPLGEYHKKDIKAIAHESLHEVSFSGESVDLCFISRDYHSLIEDKAGKIVNQEGKVLGSHKGIHRYTIGQRQGLGIAAPQPLYVVDIRPESNEIVVGEKAETFRTEMWVEEVHSLLPGELDKEIKAKAKIRYASPEQDCISHPIGNKLKITFNEAQFAITKGQSAVFYQEDRLLGGGIICS
ncbi:MAG TPA: tRNA 2-thiouridine(34) synthase MnmA [Caldisericia bacterium]|nr:tRNA 2-thiouridine(34) synthase MnmA [Caldisericia bacterium]